jgi:phage terminase large subunit
MEIQLPYQFTPRPYQLPILQAIDSGYTRLIQIWHRRSGKEKTDLNIVAKKMMERVGTYFYFFPTYKQGRKVVWDGRDKDGFKFLDHFPKELLDGKPNDTEMKLRYTNGSLFQIVGIDNIDSIVGSNPVGCVFSEYSLQNPKGWDFIRPILAENGGWAIFNFTPRGKNHAFDLYEMAKDDPHWFVQLLTVDDTQILSKETLEQERREIVAKNGDDAHFFQEYYCSFTAALIGAYYAKQYEAAEKAGRFTNVPYDPLLKVHTVWDLGISDATAIGFFQATGFERRMIDYLEVTGKGLPEIVKLLKEKPYIYGSHFAPHDIKVRELGTGKSRLETAATLGINFQVVPEIGIQDGIDAGRRFFNKLWVDKTLCKDWLRLIPQYTKEYDEDKKIYKDKPNHDWTSHGADMFRYAALVEDQMSNDSYGYFEQEQAMTDEERYRGIGLL